MSCTRAASCSLGTGARNMTDYIERKAAFDAAPEHFCDSARTLEAIETLPAADVRPVVRGRWEWMGPCRDSGGRLWATCTACGIRQRLGDFTMFCPNCGADMKGESEQ